MTTITLDHHFNPYPDHATGVRSIFGPEATVDLTLRTKFSGPYFTDGKTSVSGLLYQIMSTKHVQTDDKVTISQVDWDKIKERASAND